MKQMAAFCFPASVRDTVISTSISLLFTLILRKPQCKQDDKQQLSLALCCGDSGMSGGGLWSAEKMLVSGVAATQHS